MARLVKDRIKQTTTTTGANNLALNGSVAGYQNFSVLGDGNTTFYCIEDANGTAFEVGIGTYTSNTLARTTILDSTNSGSAISLTSGTHDVFVTYPAGRAGFNDEGLSPTLTASGTVTAGKPVIQNTNGTVTQVAETTPTIAAGLGTKKTTELASSVYDQQAAMGINGQFVSVYRQGNDFMCQVNTVSATDLKTITHGTSQLTFNLSSSTDVGIIYQPDADKYVLFYKNGSSYLTGSVMTVSGTGASATLATATAVVLRSDAMNGSPSNNNFAYDTTNDVIVGAWVESGTIKSVSMPISGTTISANGVNSVPANSGSISSNQCRVAYSSTANKVIWFYSDGSSEDLYTTVGSVNGTGLDFGSATIVSNLPTGNFNGNDMCVGVDNNGVVVISYLAQDISPSYTLFSQAGTISGTTITWGSPSQVSNVTCLNNAGNECSIAPIASGKMIIARATRSDSASNADKGIFAIVTSSGTTVSNGSVQIYSSTASRYPSLAVNYSKTQAVINWGDSASMDMNNIVYLESQQSGSTVTNLTNDNYFGIASNSATTTNPVQINVPGSINNSQTSLTVDKDYYTTSAGNIVTRLNGSGVAQATQFVGTALSATALSLREFPASTIVGKADGAVTKGKPVIVEADGDFAQVSGTSDSGSEINLLSQNAMGSGAPASYNSIASASDGNGTTCFVYRNSSQYVVAQLVTTNASGVTTYGTESSIFSVQSDCRHCGVNYDPNYNDGAGGFYITIQRNSNSRTYLIGILYSGTTITYGDDTLWTSGSTTAEVLFNAFDSTNDKTYVWTSKPYSSMTAVTNHTGDYFQAGSPNFAFGSASSRMQFGNMIYDNTNNRGTIFYRDESNSDYPTAMAYTVSGTTFTFGTAKVLESSAAFYINGAEGEADGNGTICVWNNGGNTALKSTVLSYSGTTITNGAIVTINSSSTIESYQHLTYNKKSKQYLAVISTETGADPTIPYVFVGTYSSGAMTWGSKIALSSTLSNGNQLHLLSIIINDHGNGAQNMYISRTNASSSYIMGGVYASAYSNTTTNLTAENYIGIAQETVSTGNDVKVTTVSGVDANQSSLTPAQIYYVQIDGTLSTTAGSPSVVAGTAIASTQLLVSRS